MYEKGEQKYLEDGFEAGAQYRRTHKQSVKCVVVGDTDVGKSRLVCSYVFNHGPIHVRSLYQRPHIPSVFGIDQYDNNSTVAEKSEVEIDGTCVKLRIWDTFGDHVKNRKYAYEDAHVVVICYNIACRNSFMSVKQTWLPEIKRFCPCVSIVLVATQLDRRHTDPSVFVKSVKIISLSKLLHGKGSSLEPEVVPLITPSEGRQLCDEIDADSYLEVSVVTKHGVDQVFENAIRSALFARQKIPPSYSTYLSMVKNCIQKPYLPPRPEQPEIVQPNITEPDYSCLFGDTNLSDVTLYVGEVTFYTHSLVLMSSSRVFYRLLMHPQVLKSLIPDENNFTECPAGLKDEFLRGFSDVNVYPRAKCKLTARVENVSPDSFRKIIYYAYFGKLYGIDDKLYEDAKFLEMENLTQYVEYFHQECLPTKLISERLRLRSMKISAEMYKSRAYSDVAFADGNGEVIPAHKQILVARCPVMAGMFRGTSFLEASTSTVHFESFEKGTLASVLEYLYKGRCMFYQDITDTLIAANFLCLENFLVECERAFAKDILQQENERSVFSRVIDMYRLASFHEFKQLENWCLVFMQVNYEPTQASENWTRLKAETRRTLEEKQWPPLWYLEEKNYQNIAEELSQENTKKYENVLKRFTKKQTSTFSSVLANLCFRIVRKPQPCIQ